MFVKYITLLLSKNTHIKHVQHVCLKTHFYHLQLIYESHLPLEIGPQLVQAYSLAMSLAQPLFGQFLTHPQNLFYSLRRLGMHRQTIVKNSTLNLETSQVFHILHSCFHLAPRHVEGASFGVWSFNESTNEVLQNKRGRRGGHISKLLQSKKTSTN